MSFIPFISYNKNQIILNSDRLLLNSKDDSIFLISNKTISLSANESVHINIGEKGSRDQSKKLVVNSPKIEFGLSSKGRLEPIAKGETTEDIFNEILSALSTFSSGLQSAAGIGSGVINLAQINASSQALSLRLKTIKQKVVNIKSKTTYSI